MSETSEPLTPLSVEPEVNLENLRLNFSPSASTPTATDAAETES